MTDNDVVLKNPHLVRPVTVGDLHDSLVTAIDTLAAVADKIAPREENMEQGVFKCVGPRCPEPEKEMGDCVAKYVTGREALLVILAWLSDCNAMTARLPQAMVIPLADPDEGDADKARE